MTHRGAAIRRGGTTRKAHELRIELVEGKKAYLQKLSSAGSRHSLSVTLVPIAQLLPQPRDALIGVANKASVGTVLLTITRSHLGTGNVVNGMRHGFETHRGHDLWHVAGGAAAALRIGGVMSVRFQFCRVFSMALETHLVGVIQEFQRSFIAVFRRMKVVTVATMGMPLLIALGSAE